MNHIYFTTLFRKSKKTIFNVFLFLLLAYFVFHSIYGNRGIIAYFSLNSQLEKAYSELDTLKAERVEVEHRVKLLRPESLDKDMLDQEARRILGMALPKEQVFTAASLKSRN